MTANTMESMDNQSESRGGGVFRWIGWSFLFLALLAIFTVVKIPQAKIQSWIVGTLNQQLAPAGMQLSADDGHVAFGLGLKYEMTGVRLTKVTNQKVLKFSRLEVAPSLIVPLLQGKFGATLRLEEGSGVIAADVFKKGDDIEVSVNIDGVNLGRMGILPFLAGAEGTADIKGTIELTGNPVQVTSFNGKIDLTIAKLTIDGQKIAGFDIPRTSISDGVINMSLAAGKATLTNFRLGKPGSTDDLFGNVTGDVKLNRNIESSDLNLKAKFGFSERYRKEKTISLVDSLFGAFKTPDGTFAMAFNGPLYAAQPSPTQ